MKTDDIDTRPLRKARRLPVAAKAGLGCLLVALLLAALATGLFLWIGSSVPGSYRIELDPLPPPDAQVSSGGGLAGFDSPYIGHTGSWDGMGGGIFGSSKTPALDREADMGLRWTFMCVYWSKMEPAGPVDLDDQVPPAWQSLDAFVVEARRRNLNILMQAPVVGGNAGGPPDWAGRREAGKSAPADMEALAAFAGSLARRYCPGGTLAQEQGWGTGYGVRTWELDNEPESYLTHWDGQAADYAEFVTKAAAAIKAVDPHALILTPTVASGRHAVDWLRGALDAQGMEGSPLFRERNRPYSIGPATDAVTFHNYEGLDTFFAGEDVTVVDAFQQVRTVFEEWEDGSPGFTYERKLEYWHTEGNFDFIGALSEERRAAWRIQFFTRAFAAGIRKVAVMDAKPLERIAVKTYVQALPHPFPMNPATETIKVLDGDPMAFLHPDGDGERDGRVWIVWAVANSGGAVVEIPILHDHARLRHVDGRVQRRPAMDGRIRIELQGDAKMPPPIIIEDRP